ncbi:unnamed protein product, partial [Urochloa humidicola]
RRSRHRWRRFPFLHLRHFSFLRLDPEIPPPCFPPWPCRHTPLVPPARLPYLSTAIGRRQISTRIRPYPRPGGVQRSSRIRYGGSGRTWERRHSSVPQQPRSHLPLPRPPWDLQPLMHLRERPTSISSPHRRPSGTYAVPWHTSTSSRRRRSSSRPPTFTPGRHVSCWNPLQRSSAVGRLPSARHVAAGAERSPEHAQDEQ